MSFPVEPFAAPPFQGAGAGALEADEVRLRPAARQSPERLGAVAYELAEPAEHARLDGAQRRRVAPRRAVLVDGRGDGVGPDRDGQRRRVEEAEVARARNVH